jgi:hypothetical protein
MVLLAPHNNDQHHNERKSPLVLPVKNKTKNKADLTDGNVELSRSACRYKEKKQTNKRTDG